MNPSEPKAATLEFVLPGSRACDSVRKTAKPSEAERIPRITKLLALAIKLDGMLTANEVKSRAELARAGQVSRARVTQIMALLDLAPSIQEHILSLKCPAESTDPIRERHLREITQLVRWDEQRLRYEQLCPGKRIEKRTDGR